MTSSTSTSMSTSPTGMVKLCFNSNCKRPLEQPRNGWRRRSGDFAQLCDLCASAYEDGKFCEAFHLNASGWRCCETCGKQIHCGCIVSFHMFVLLDAGGIECLTCTKKSFILTPNPAWPPSSLFLPSQPERIQDLSAKSWNPIAGSGPVPWQQAPTPFNGSSIYSELQAKAPFECDASGGISRFLHGDRVSASSLECNKNEDSFERLISESLNNGGFEVLENGNAAFNCDDQSNTCLSGSQRTYFLENDSSTQTVNLAIVSSSKSEENDHAKISLASTRPSTHLTSVGKQTGGHNGLETSLGAQGRTRKARGDARNHLLPRYWPRITDQELQQIRGDTKFIITPLFEKMLTASDAGRMGRLVLPKKCAEAYLPAISHPEGVPLKVQDLKGNEWVFQFRFWPNNNSRMYVLEGVTPCIQSMQLQAGDIVIFSRIEPEGKLVLGGRKTSTAPPLDQGNEAVITGGGVSANVENNTKSAKPDEIDSTSIRAAIDKSGFVAKEGVKAKPSVCFKRKNSTLSSKSKRMRIENGDMIKLKLTRKQAQGLIRPAPNAISKVILIEGCEFEEYEDAPIIGRPTIPTSDDTGEKIQWVQCEDCLKWRKIPASTILPSRWTCSQNFWNPERSVCSAAQELTAEQLGDLLPTVRKAAFRKIRMPNEELVLVEPLEGLDTLANLAIGEEGASLQATTRHPRHKNGCTCIVCMQPPSGKGPKHKQSCDCMVCKSVKRRFRTLMTNREKKHLVKDIEIANQIPGQDVDINPCNEVGTHVLRQESVSHEGCNDSNEWKSPTSPINARIDLNIHPVREDRLPLTTGSTSILHLLHDVNSCSALGRVHEISNTETHAEIDADFLNALCEDTMAPASTI